MLLALWDSTCTWGVGGYARTIDGSGCVAYTLGQDLHFGGLELEQLMGRVLLLALWDSTCTSMG